MGDGDSGQVQWPWQVGWPVDLGEKDQKRHAQAYFWDDDRQGHGAFDQPLERKTKAPEHDRSQRAYDQADDRRQKRDGERIDHRFDQAVIVQRLFIIFKRETLPHHVALAVVKAENHQDEERRIEEQHGQPNPTAHPKRAGIFKRGDGGAVKHQRASFTLFDRIDCSAIKMNIA